MNQSKVNTISDDLAVEVYGSNNAWFKAWVIDVFKTTALCTFENGWKPNQYIPFLRIRKLPEYSINYAYSLNEDVEVKSNTNPSCWWPATINLISGDRNTFSIVYSSTGSGTKSNYAGDLVGRDRIRPMTQSKFFHEAMLYKYSVEVPDKMMECADIPGVLDDVAFKHFREDTQASLIRYDKETRKIVVLTPHMEVYKDVEACFDYQLSLLEKKVDQLLRKKRYADRLQPDTPTAPVTSTSPSTTATPAPTTSFSQQRQYREEFKIHPNFMGLAIGARGKNINECRRIPGIIALDLEEEACHFKIVGETKEAVKEARNKLEYSELVIEVDRNIASRIVGRNGKTIQTIVDESGCVRVRLDNPKNADGSEGNITRFIFTGTQLALNRSKILTNCQVQHAKDTVALAEQNLHADTLLRNKLYRNPSPRNTPLLTPRAPITPPYPSNEQGEKGVTPQEPEGAATINRPQSELHQTPTAAELPKVERLTIETQTEPLEVEFVKPAPPRQLASRKEGTFSEHLRSRDSQPLKHVQEESCMPAPRQPLQRRQYHRDDTSRSSDNHPRDTYRTGVRDPPSRRTRESPRTVDQELRSSGNNKPAPPQLAKPAKPLQSKPLQGKPLQQKPRVDIKLANEKIESALAADNKSKAEEVRSEQQAAIEDLVKAEQKSKPFTEEDVSKENNQNVQQGINNQNVKIDNQKKENDNLSKVADNGDQIIQTMVNEALVCEFSPSN